MCAVSEDKRNAPSREIDRILRPVLHGTVGPPDVPSGFDYLPFGRDVDCLGVDPTEIPQTLDDLGELVSSSYDLTVRRAGELNIPIAGSVSGGFNRRVVVFEWTRFKELTGSDGTRCRYGYIIRFCLTVSEWNVQTKVSLPYLSAQAELGNLEASWLMNIRGLVGKDLDAVVLPPQELKVETFVTARQSMESAIKAVHSSTTKFIPEIITAQIKPASEEEEYWHDTVTTLAVSCVRRGWTRIRAQDTLPSTDPSDADRLTEVYRFFGLEDPGEVPVGAMRERAAGILRGLRVE